MFEPTPTPPDTSWADWLTAGPAGGPDTSTPLCTDPADIASWSVPGSVGVPTCHPDPTASELATGPWLADVRNNLTSVVKTLSTFFLTLPDPKVGDPDTGAPADVVAFLQSGLMPLTGFLMVLAIMLGAGRIIWDSRRSGEHARAVVELLVRYVLTASLAVPLVAAGLLIASEYSDWVIANSTPGTSFEDNMLAMLAGPGSGLTGLLGILLLAVAALASLLLCVLLVIRGGTIFVLLGTVLVAASMSNLDTGKDMFRKHAALLIALVSWKAVAATVFAAGFRLMSGPLSTPDGVRMWCYGLAVLVTAIWSLPVVMRMIAPAVAPAANGRGFGPVAVAGVATAAGASALRVVK